MEENLLQMCVKLIIPKFGAPCTKRAFIPAFSSNKKPVCHQLDIYVIKVFQALVFKVGWMLESPRRFEKLMPIYHPSKFGFIWYKVGLQHILF